MDRNWLQMTKIRKFFSNYFFLHFFLVSRIRRVAWKLRKCNKNGNELYSGILLLYFLSSFFSHNFILNFYFVMLKRGIHIFFHFCIFVFLYFCVSVLIAFIYTVFIIFIIFTFIFIISIFSLWLLLLFLLSLSSLLFISLFPHFYLHFRLCLTDWTDMWTNWKTEGSWTVRTRKMCTNVLSY